MAGIFGNKEWLSTDYVTSLAAYDRHFTTRLDSNIFLRTTPGADVGQVQAALTRALTDHPDVTVENAAHFEKSVGAGVDTVLGLVTALLLLAVVIALLGIVNTLALSVFERTRELGLLRAVGMTRGQVRAMVRWEAVIIAIIGAVLGTAIGIGFGVALSRALKDLGVRSVQIPYGSLALYIVAAAVAGVLAAIGPARSAAKVDVLRAGVTE
ncbi:MAG: ABC transporter permease [Nocardioidaceae bacterium]